MTMPWGYLVHIPRPNHPSDGGHCQSNHTLPLHKIGSDPTIPFIRRTHMEKSHVFTEASQLQWSRPFLHFTPRDAVRWRFQKTQQFEAHDGCHQGLPNAVAQFKHLVLQQSHDGLLRWRPPGKPSPNKNIDFQPQPQGIQLPTTSPHLFQRKTNQNTKTISITIYHKHAPGDGIYHKQHHQT